MNMLTFMKMFPSQKKAVSEHKFRENDVACESSP